MQVSSSSKIISTWAVFSLICSAAAYTNSPYQLNRNYNSLSPKIRNSKSQYHVIKTPSHSTSLSMSSEEYSREIRLREEAESPFRKVRFFGYATLITGALISFAVSGSRVAAGLAGINTDLMDQSITNVEADLAGILVLGFLYKRDLDAQNVKLKRAAKGAELAKLMVRGTPALLDRDTPGAKNTVIPLSSFRSGRGIDKRVVIAAAGKDKIEEILEQAKNYADALIASDLVIVPVVLPQGTGPLGLDKDLIEQDYLALPAGGNWQSVIGDEAAIAEEQGVDVSKEGICVIMKKNGRVGQRTKGIYIERMCGEVTQRREMGMDVNNI